MASQKKTKEIISPEKKGLMYIKLNDNMMKGRVLTVDTGSLTTKIGYFKDGEKIFAEKLVHNAEELGQFKDIMDQGEMRRKATISFLNQKGISPDDIDIIMARGGLFEPVKTGIYIVNDDMKDVLLSCRESTHACNLSAVIADEIAESVNKF